MESKMSESLLARDITEEEAKTLLKKMLAAMGCLLIVWPKNMLKLRIFYGKASTGIGTPCLSNSYRETIDAVVNTEVLWIEGNEVANVFYGCKSIEEIKIRLDFYKD